MKERLKELRKALGIKQRELADRLGVKVSNVGAWEIGRQPIPDTRVYQICNEYGVNRAWLESGSGDMFAPDSKPKSDAELLQEAATRILKELSPRGQAAFIEAVKSLESSHATH